MNGFPRLIRPEEGFPKLIYQDSNDELYKACAGLMTRYVGNDGGFDKWAASEVFPAHKLAEYAPPKGKFMMHAVAMGASEWYGANKNGDAFDKEALFTCHPTFVTNGHMFREHRNRDPKLAIGEIKASAYHPTLNRVELVLWGDCDKAAEEYARVKAGKALSYSMSCRVPWDVCSCCDNHAKSAAVYCDHLRRHMLQFLPEFGKYAFAKNPNPKFFDMSSVGNPADRIAHMLQARVETFAKAASAGVLTGAELAVLEGVRLPGAGTPIHPARREQLRKLAAAEERLEQALKSGFARNSTDIKMAEARAAFSVFDPDAKLNLAGVNCRPGTLFRHLAKRACLLSPASFWSYVTGGRNYDPAMDSRLSHAFRDAYKRACCDDCEMPTHSCDMGSSTEACLDPDNDAQIDELMDRADELFGVGGDLSPKIIRIEIRKSASAPAVFYPCTPTTPEDEAFIEAYACYKAAAVANIQELHPGMDEEKLCLIAAAQNLKLSY